MRIVEILLPKGTNDRSLSPQVIRKIDALQARMDLYVDKIMSPATNSAGKEFLKSRLRDDYYELKDLLPRVHQVAEETEKYEVYDRRSGEKVSGPYSNRKRASIAANKKDLEYGAIRYGYRLVKTLTEAVHKLPLTEDDFELVKKLMERPIPAAIAPIYISEIIEDDELNDQIRSLEENEPNRDVRPIIAEWFKRVMPDQMYRFIKIDKPKGRPGMLSPIHGYDPHIHKAGALSHTPQTGNNAYGFR